MSIEISAQNKGGGESNVVSFFKYLSATALFAVSARLLTRHGKGENVDNELTSLCDELEKRSGISFPGCHITGPAHESGSSPNPSDTLEFVGSAILILALIYVVFLALSSRRKVAF